ncbi:MAG: hypothetical protein LLF76_10850 [Planctomycetaceae bacterium]|nr:hypothetical protein [Planctomycetaceae bacterium]
MKHLTPLNLCILAGLIFTAGCGGPDDPLSVFKQTEMAPQPGPPMVIEQADQDIQKRFESGPDEQKGAVQNAVLWAQRYEEMSLKNNELREQNNKLALQNNQLQHDAEKVKLQLESTRKELNEANEFLQQMHVELTKWKSDVLGFRDEMRQAQQAQLEALAKILKLLGAEPIEQPDSARKQPAPAGGKE